MSKKTNKESTAIEIVHALYYYLVIAATVLSLSTASFMLIRRVLIDTVLPDLRVDYYYETYYYTDCQSNFEEGLTSQECTKREEEAKEMQERQYRRERAEQYLYSILTIMIAAIVMGTHIKFFRPGR